MNDKKYSFVIAPPNQHFLMIRRPPRSTLYLLIGFLIFIVIIISTTFYVAYETSADLSQYKKLKKETAQQKSEFRQIEKELQEIKDNITVLFDKEEEIQNLLGDAKTKRRKKKTEKKNRKIKAAKLKAFKTAYKEANSKELSIEETIIKKILLYKNHLANSTNAITSLHLKAQQYKARFASTPSIYPVYGRVLSKFGWRRHPVTGKRRYHKGIDIASWRGAPIHAAADGLIEYSGWSGTFGYVIVIDHEFGYRTIYAHCSKLLVRKNELVKKGQVIAQVGSTGLSTGPHLHFEIRKWRQAISPTPYLNLDMFTASNRIW
jgi:murein DD-endopeptidase MepM/ murein hydrolase activator NlpD